MKCKPLALRVLSTAAMMSIVASCAAPAFAATYDLTAGDVYVRAESDGKQYVSQWTDDNHTTYASDDDGEINHREDNNVTLTSHNKETKNTIAVSADEGQEAKVTLDDVNIDTRDEKDSPYTEGDAAMAVTGAGDVTVELDGNNVLTSGTWNAGLQKNDSDSTGTLTIQDSNDKAGSLTATGGMGGAGIGSSAISDDHYNNGTENITITGGKIAATGGQGAAGIGGSYTLPYGKSQQDVKNITITGGELTVTGGANAAGIGSGYNSEGDVSGIHISGTKNTTITGGTISAAIGGGAFTDINAGDRYLAGTVSDIKISDADLTAVAGPSGVAIGTGYGHHVGEDFVSITGNSHITVKKNETIHDTQESPSGSTTFIYGDSAWIGVGGDCKRQTNTPIPSEEMELDFPCLVPGSLTYVNKDGEVVKVIKGKDHQWDNGVVTTPASCFTDGLLTYTCKKCGAVKTEIIPAKGAHTWGEWETVKEATTTETGLRQRTCSVCGKVEQEELPVLTPEIPDTPVTPDAPETENTSTPELRVVAPDTIPQTFSVTQSGTVRTYTSPYNSGTLTGTMETLEYLQEQGAETIVFTTSQRTSSFAISDLLALVNEGDVFYLSHMDATDPTLLVVANDHTNLLN